MNKEVAVQVKENILDKIVDSIPASIVEPLWQAYVSEFNPADKSTPCTCLGHKVWVPIVTKLREKVEEALSVEAQAFVETQIEPKQKKSKK